MPFYTYSCPRCQKLKQDIRCISERHDGPRCDCGAKMRLLVDPVAGIVHSPAVPRGRS